MTLNQQEVPMSDVSFDEEITEQDVKQAEAGERPPVGKYLCVCKSATYHQKDFKDYSCIAARLGWEIHEALEVEGVTVENPEDFEHLEGRPIFDEVAMYHPQEKDGMKKRRVLIAKKIGLIPSTGGKITPQTFKVDIIGKWAIVQIVEEEYPDKAGIKKSIRKIPFAGYESPDENHQTQATTAAETTVSAEDI